MRCFNTSTMLSLGVLAVVALADYNFPSAMPPGGKKPSEVKQIVTFIWDDNAYSGKTGSNYEGPAWLAAPEFANMGWVGGRRVEGDWSTSGKNDLNLKEGDMGMSWAAYTLAGFTPEPAMAWSPMATYTQGDVVRYNDTIWTASAWIGAGTKPQAVNPADYPNWDAMAQWERDEILRKFPWVGLGANPPRPVGTPTSSRKNPDGTNISFTFNIISGFMVPTWPKTWDARESKYGYYKPNAEFYPDGKILHSKVAVSWGREMPIYDAAPTDSKKEVMDSTKLFVQGYILQAFDEAYKLGHELGNHTIDHMESNSPLPNSISKPYGGAVEGVAYRDGFARWNSEGFDSTKLDTLPWGQVVDEAAEFGQRDGNVWQYMGWKMYAGKYISKEAWKGAIQIAEEEMDIAYGISVAKGNLFAFRAPRLEVSSGLHFALKELGYLYDCGQEEGYDYHVDGTNFLWPYTTDNSSPNLSWQRAVDEQVTIDSMPAGFWQIPVNAMIVPQNLRSAVYANHAIIARAEAVKGSGQAPTPEDSIDWVNNSGKVTGFDFNMFILWGMTKDNVLATLKYNLDQRLVGNKAPMQIGCHTDYFTPIYDNATLRNSVNISTYGLCVVNGWNTWSDRIATFEEFITYGLSKGAHFYSGKQTIDYIKSLQAGGEEVGTQPKSPTSWTYFKNDALTGSTYTGSLTSANLSNIQVTVPKAVGSEYPDDGFAWTAPAGTFTGMTHLELNYNTTAPLVVRLVKSDGSTLETVLGSLKNNVKSGLIPISAFHENQYESSFTKGGVTAYPGVNTADIIGFEFQLLTSGTKTENHTVSLSNVVAHTGSSTIVPINPAKPQSLNGLAIRSVTSSTLALSLPVTGVYTVEVLSIDGRVIKSFKNQNFSEGVHTLALNKLSQGVYMVRVANRVASLQKTMKMVVR